ncbi:MAG: L-threonylcarbamoyladenylate synthase [Patescibacteria group bacterium]|nr:L-threonylcarbamoyladenylate synthase [Patescibacteria group bacterium]
MATCFYLDYDADMDELDIESAASAILAGEIVVFPTETAYGLGVDATNERALQKMYQLKKRPLDKPSHICVKDVSEAKQYVAITDEARTLANAFWPGPLTLILESRGVLPQLLERQDRTLGIRVPDHPMTKQLLEKTRVPITATSANMTGDPTPYSIEEVRESFGAKIEKIAALLDTSTPPHNPPSTILDLTSDKPKILRHGPITSEEINRVLLSI